MDTIKIGRFIAENRKKKKMTQEQLAEKLGVTSKTISRWENGNYMPDISILKPLSVELDEYYIVDTEKKYTKDTVPVVPFNRDKSGIDNILKYKNKYVGNNSNDGNLLNSLPLSEYGLVFEIDSEKLGLTVDYHITDWYINDKLYVEKSLIYNTVSIFSLIDNVEYIQYNFTGKTYRIDKSKVLENYPNYNKINDNGINKDNFNNYLESKINDDTFIKDIFNKLFI